MFAIDGISRGLGVAAFADKAVRGRCGAATDIIHTMRHTAPPPLTGAEASSMNHPRPGRIRPLPNRRRRAAHITPWKHPPARGSAVHPLSPTASHTLFTFPRICSTAAPASFLSAHSPSGREGQCVWPAGLVRSRSPEADTVLPPPVPVLPGQKDWVIDEIEHRSLCCSNRTSRASQQVGVARLESSESCTMVLDRQGAVASLARR